MLLWPFTQNATKPPLVAQNRVISSCPTWMKTHFCGSSVVAVGEPEMGILLGTLSCKDAINPAVVDQAEGMVGGR